VASAERAVRRGGVVLVGEAGIGKSFAARAVAARLRARGVTVEFMLATNAASTVPFGALAGLLEPSSDAAGDLLEVLRSAGDRLSRRARGGRLAVVVDDAHWLDPASAALLLALVMRHGIWVLATVRTGAQAPDAVHSLWKDAGLPRTDLAPLSEGAAAEVVRHLLGGPIERGTRRWLWECSAGNPLFLRELVRSGIDQRALVQQHRHWRRVGSIPPPERLLDLLDERIDALTAGERRSLALVALVEPASLELLGRLDALDGARALESRGLLAGVETPAGAGLRVGHPLYGEAVRASLRVTEARDLHAELARQLDPTSEPVRLRLATWALEDGEPGGASDLTEAADAALAAFDPQLAIRLGRAGLAARPGIAAALPLAAALRAVGRFEEVETCLADVEDEARASARVTSYLFVRATNLAWGLGRAQDAHALLARVNVEPAGAAVAAALHSAAGLPGETVSCARRVLASSAIDRLAQAIAAIAAGHDLAVIGDPRGALSVLDRVERSVGSVESEWPRAAVALFGAFYGAEQWQRRRQALVERHASARAAGDDARAALCELVFARLAVPAGDLQDAHRLAQDALARLAFMDPRALAPACHSVIAEAQAVAGDADAARAAWQDGIALLEAGQPNPLARGLLDNVLPLVLAAEGEHPKAQEGALRRARAAGEAVMIEAEMLHLFLRVGGPAGQVADRLEQIASSTQAGMAELWARQAIASRDDDAAELDILATLYERIGARLYAAEAAAQAAIAYRAGGSGNAGARAEAHAARLATACRAGGLTLVSTMRLSGLNAREQQTARLVTLGLSNAQIAARLSLSVRTVESHVYRATNKLGVHDRAAMAALLGAGRAVNS
jgi:DNA-binding NarL/FixJ family response regulator